MGISSFPVPSYLERPDLHRKGRCFFPISIELLRVSSYPVLFPPSCIHMVCIVSFHGQRTAVKLEPMGAHGNVMKYHHPDSRQREGAHGNSLPEVQGQQEHFHSRQILHHVAHSHTLGRNPPEGTSRTHTQRTLNLCMRQTDCSEKTFRTSRRRDTFCMPPNVRSK